MGKSDKEQLAEQVAFLDSLISSDLIEKKEVMRVAFLGNPDWNDTCTYYSAVFPNIEADFYDIKLNNWDINKEWNIEGYDLVVCHRTTPYIESVKQFTEQLKLCIVENKYVIFDFVMYAGILKNSSSDRLPPGRGAVFDFRNLFLRMLQTNTSPEDESFDTSIEEDLQLKPEYVDVFNYAFTENTLMENNIPPLIYTLGWNSIKGDLNTYMIWKNESL